MFWVKREIVLERKIKRGSGRGGIRCEQDLLFGFFRLIVILRGGFGTDGAVWRRVLG